MIKIFLEIGGQMQSTLWSDSFKDMLQHVKLIKKTMEDGLHPGFNNLAQALRARVMSLQTLLPIIDT
jgi:hypothetical protein